MNKLFAEFQRLYDLPEQPLAAPAAGEAMPAFQLVGADDKLRTMVVGFERAADWEHAARLFQAVQEDFDWPAPALSVSGSDGYQLWFSLAEPIPAEKIRRFFAALRRTFLQDVPAAHLKFWPDDAASLTKQSSPLTLPPALHPTTGKWSAFIDPGMGGMFSEAPGLEMMPVMDRQADLLSGLKSISASEFERTLACLQNQTEAATTLADRETASPSSSPLLPHPQAAPASPVSTASFTFSDPKSFLLAVMNDPSASLDQRIEAAKALLPYADSTAD